jgi:hypothetical protein
MAMETTRRFDAESLSRLIERRLQETNRQDQAAAFVQLGILRVLLDAISKDANPTRDLPLAEISRVLRDRPHHKHHGAVRLGRALSDPDVPPVFLTHIDSDHQALIFDFDSVVDQIGELSVALHGLVTSESAPNTEMQKRFCTLWTDDPHDILPVRQRIPLKGSLAQLKPVGELSEAYQNPDFSKNRLRPKHFLR